MTTSLRLSDLPLAKPTRSRAVVTITKAPVERLAGYARRVGADYQEILAPDSAYPQGYRFVLQRLIDMYERVVFIAPQVELWDKFPDLFAAVPEDLLGLRDEWDRVPNRSPLMSDYLRLIKSQGWAGMVPPESYFSTDMVVASRSHRDAFALPARPFHGIPHAERLLVNLNVVRHEVPVTSLSVEEAPAKAIRKAGGPGTRLRALLASHAVNPASSCSCNRFLNQLDEWGEDRCRGERGVILARLEQGQRAWGWERKLVAAGVTIAELLYAALEGEDMSHEVVAQPQVSARSLVAPRGQFPGGSLDPWSYVSTARMVGDAVSLVPHLPPDADTVIGVSRSGLLPATAIATHLHLPLLTVGGTGVINDPGRGVRLDTGIDPRHVLLVDDTVAQGRSMRSLAPVVKRAYPKARVTRVAVYAHPNALHAVDYAWATYPGRHFLEWNWQNAGHGESCGFDMDGILCRDARPEEDDDGPRYKKFLLEATPLHLPRRRPVTVVATARHEKYRAETEAWLKQHRVEVKKLVMRDWDYPERGRWGAVARWKAGVFKKFQVSLVAESDPYQARIVADVTERPVVCPAAERVFVKNG